MFYRFFASCFFIFLFYAGSALAYVELLKLITLKDGREIILMFDAYEGYSVERNHDQALLITISIKTLARNNTHCRMSMSYEDSCVYDAKNLMPHFDYLSQSCAKMPSNHMIALIDKDPGNEIFDVLAFKKPERFSSFLAGEFSLACALMAKLDPVWPNNIIIRSNDPRQEQFLALTNDRNWLAKNGETLVLKDLITPSSAFRQKVINFCPHPELDPKILEKIKVKAQDFSDLIDEQLEAFANFISMKTAQDFSVSDLDKSIQEFLADGMDIMLAHEFIKQVKTHGDVYGEAPILDLILDLFAANSADLHVVILGKLKAVQFERELQDFDAIESSVSLDLEKTLNAFFQEK